jgi:hypothetical protein
VLPSPSLPHVPWKLDLLSNRAVLECSRAECRRSFVKCCLFFSNTILFLFVIDMSQAYSINKLFAKNLGVLRNRSLL